MTLAKLTQPRTINTVLRPRLFRLLDRAGKKTVTWVWAPPGAGKTTLVSTYLANCKYRTLWYQTDAGDNDVATFFYYIGLAAPKRKRPMPLFTPEYRMGLPIFARNFFRELFSRFSSSFTLVFDNFQEIHASSELYVALQHALAEIPQGGRVIFISRGETPAPFAYIRAKQDMDTLGWDELRFTRNEVNDLVKRLAPGRWPKNAIDRLYKTADGWGAGLVLLLDQLRKDGTTQTTADQRTPQVLFDYFAAEILKQTDADTKQLLLQTSFLPLVGVSMAEKLTALSNAGDILAALHRRNYFTSKRPGAQPIYEYHPLFRDFLLAEAKRSYSLDRQNQIRRQAASFLETVGRIEAAAALYCDAEDWKGLARLLCANAHALIGQGRWKVIEQWIAWMPQSSVDTNPWLLYWRGTAKLGWEHAESQRDLERAYGRFDQYQDKSGMLLCAATLIIAIQASFASRPMDRWIDAVENLMRDLEGPLPVDIETLVTTAMLSGIMLRRTDHPDGHRWAQRAVELAPQNSNLAFRAITLTDWVGFKLQVGRSIEAGRTIEALRSLFSDKTVSSLVAVTASCGISYYEFRLALPTYRQTVSKSLQIADSSGMLYSAKHGAVCHGLMSAISHGDVEVAESWLHELERDPHTPSGPGFHCFYQSALVGLALVKGDLDRAAAHQPEMLRYGIEAGWPMLEIMVELRSAIVLNARGLKVKARYHIDSSLEIAAAMRSPYFEFMAKCIEAHVEFENGNEAVGRQALRRAMELGRVGGIVNSAVWLPYIMAGLCAKALEHGIEPDYVRTLIKKRHLVLKELPIESEHWPWPVKIYTLGQFQVLKDDLPLHFSHKVQRKPLALLKTIIAMGAQKVREEILLDILWPESDGDAARFAFNSAIHRLRRLLGHEETIFRQDNEVTLNPCRCWLDLVALERLLEKAETLTEDDEKTVTEKIDLIHRAAKLYQGPFLGDEPESSFGNRHADRLRRRLVQLLTGIGQHWENRERLPDAIQNYEEALRIDSCAEDICRQLMTAYHRLGRPSEVASTYQACKQALETRVGTQPCAETDRLLSVLLGK